MTTRPSERNQDIYSLRQRGATFRAISKQHGVSVERVRQICHRVDRWLVRTKERDRCLEESGLTVMADESAAVGLLVKLDAIAVQLDEIERAFGQISAWTNLPIDALEVTVRASNSIRNVGIETVGDLLRWSEADLLKIPNMGRKSVRELQEIVAELGGELPTVSRLMPNEREIMDAFAARRWDQAWSLIRTRRQSGDSAAKALEQG